MQIRELRADVELQDVTYYSSVNVKTARLRQKPYAILKLKMQKLCYIQFEVNIKMLKRGVNILKCAYKNVCSKIKNVLSK
jgi:hypothetical protein